MTKAEVVQQFGGYQFWSDGRMSVTRKATLEDAAESERWLSVVTTYSPRWIGQWFNDIQTRFPTEYSQLLEAGGRLDYDTVVEYGRVVRKVPAWDPALSFGKHQAVAALDRHSQVEILDRARDEHLTLPEVRQAVRRLRKRTVATGAASGIYRVAYLSPVYDKTTVDQLCTFGLQEHIAMNAAVFLWVEERYRDAIQAVYEAWGVRHVATIIWNTQEHSGPSAYLSTRHQYLLWLVRGKCSPDNLVPMQESIVSERAVEAGTRPEVFRHIIDRLYDHGRKVEFFAKHERESEDWTFVGEKEAAA